MKFPALLVYLVICLLLAAPGRAEETGGTPGQQAQGFYAWYLHGLNAGGEPMLGKKAALSRYVSARFLKEIARLSKIEGGIEADPFLCAQDWDKGWEKNIAVDEVKVDGDRARCRVMLNGPEMGKHVLRVQWVREAGTWKIDRVEPK